MSFNFLSDAKIYITCEHGGNDIPEPYQYLFAEAMDVLVTHRGYDIGALSIFNALKEAKLGNFFHHTTVSRLFVELNRSPGHPRLWSEVTCNLSKTEKDSILQDYYFSYRRFVEENIADVIKKGQPVIHIAVHSFTPVFDGDVRQAEVGLLYDSRRPLEQQFCRQWQQEIRALAPSWRVRANYPYRGSSDGLATYLRKQFKPEQYLGIELEINQGLLLKSGKEVKEVISTSLQKQIFLK